MARGGINLAVVKIAREALLARGVHPSIDAVRVELGNTGSKSTIQRYLKVLAAREPTEAAPTVDEELQHFVAGLAARLTALAEEAVAEDRLRLQRERATHEQRRVQQQNQLDQLQTAHATLTHDLQALRSHERSLQEQLRDADGERRRLAQSEHNLQQLLGERAAHIHSLEDKHRQAREALEHFRQQHLTQREQETQRHDAQLQQLQQDLRSVRNQLLGKQEELARLFQDNERLVGELRTGQQLSRQHERELDQLRQLRHDADARQHSDLAQLRAVTAEHASLRERVKHHALKERQYARELRVQREQNSRLQALLDQWRSPVIPPEGAR